MKILLLLSAIPFDKGEAIDVVSHEVVRLMAAEGHDVYVQALIRDPRSEKVSERQRYAAGRFTGDPRVHLLEPIFLGDFTKTPSAADHVSALARSLPGLRGRINPYFFSAVAARPAVEARVRETGADVIASIWSWEALAASYDIPGIPKFVYYGNPNHKPMEAQLAYPDLFELPSRGPVDRLKLAGLALLNRARELQHVKMMAACEVTSNNALIDAEYYTAMGHPRSLYLQNMWPDAPGGPVFGGRDAGEGPARICGSVGNLAATGNTFGLYNLGAELAPRLERILGAGTFVIDVYGGGTARRPVAKALQHPAIRMRGWVDDLNAEIVASRVFLVLTNVYGFNVGNTRILLAWSLGSCVVAHRSSALSMPEMVHGETALLGDTSDELAELTARAVRDGALRERIGRGGYEAFRAYYRSEALVPRMVREIERTVADFRGARAHAC